jgi:uncharacterized protein YecT (DUF1311 family)
MLKQGEQPTVMKFSASFAVTLLIHFNIRRVCRLAVGVIVVGLGLTSSYADSDGEIESITNSPHGTFRIERQGKRDDKGGSATTFWITPATDPNQRVRLDETQNEPDGWHFFISPDEQWICTTVHEHSQLLSLRLYQRKTDLQFELVAAQSEDQDDHWQFDKDDRFALKGDPDVDETGRVYNYFVAWSSDSARLLVERRSQLEAKGTDGSHLWSRHYFYFNLRQSKLEHTPYLLTLNRSFRRYDSEQKKDVVPAFAEPLNSLPPEKELQQRYEAAEQRLNKAYPAFLERADDESDKQDRRDYQQLWLKARESGAAAFAAMGSKAERARRKLLYLADAAENRAHDLEAYLEERARWDKENQNQGANAHDPMKEIPDVPPGFGWAAVRHSENRVGTGAPGGRAIPQHKSRNCFAVST